MRLLIVDDEATIRDGLSKTIDWASIGIEYVDCAKNGIEALKYVKQSAPDILLTDIRLPGMDGLELAECVTRLYPKTRILLLSGYADFSYAKQAISIGVDEYLVKPVNVNDLIKKIQIIVEEITHNIPDAPVKSFPATMINILRTPGLSKEELSHLIVSAGYRWKHPWLLAGIAELFISESDAANQRLPLNAEDICPVLSDTLHTETICVPMGETNQILLFANLPGDTKPAIPENEISDFYDVISQKYNCQFTLAFSEVFLALSFYPAYQSAKNTLLYRFFIGNGVTLFPRQFSGKKYETPISPEKIQKELIQAIRSANAEICLNLIQPLFRSYRFCDISDIETIKDYCLQLVTILSAEAGRGESTENNLLRLGYIQYAEHFTTVEEYIHQVTVFYHNILAILKQSQSSKSYWIVKRSKEFMIQNYSLPLSVEQIAEQVERSPSYLCHIFNSVEGIPITEYLNKLRIEKAKELLCNTSMMSYEIAEQVGFNNYRYFTQVFKKYAGTSPTAFRNKPEVF